MEKKTTLWQIAFAQNPTPLCLLEEKGWMVVEGNFAFEKLTGYSPQDLKATPTQFQNILYKRDLRNLEMRVALASAEEYVEGDLRLMTRLRTVKEVRIQIRRILFQKKDFLLCSIQDIETQKEIEKSLRSKISQDHQNIVENAKSIFQIQNILEKMNRLPHLLQTLTNERDPQTLPQKAVEYLTSEEGLNYASCALFLIEGDWLQWAASSHECALRRFALHKGHKFAQVARGECKIILQATGEYVFPLLSGDRCEGVMQIFLEERERALLAENPSFQEAHTDFLEALSLMLGLLLETQRIQQETKQDFLYKIYHKNHLCKTIEEWQKTQTPFFFLLFSLEEKASHPFMENPSLTALLHLIKQNQPPHSILGMIENEECALLLPESGPVSPLLWVKDLKARCGRTLPSRHISMGLAKAEPSDPPFLFWEHALSCLRCAQREGGSRIFQWDQKPQEMAEKTGTKLE